MLQIDIVKDADQVEIRNATDKTGKAVQYFSQYGYVHLGGVYPQKMKISLNSINDQYPVGEYFLDLSSFRVGKFDSLEVDNFNLKLVKI